MNRSLISRMGAYAQQAKYDTRETTAKARSKFMASFEDKVDPDRVLSEAERQRRAAAERKLHFSRLAHLSAKARAK